VSELDRALEKLLLESKPLTCELCEEKIYYLDGGRYACRSCGHIMLDDFGKVKQFIEKNGPSPSAVIAYGTGVRQDIINVFLKKGRVEIPEGSRYYIKCEKCGCSIRYGRYCPECVRETARGINAAFNEYVGERPKYEIKQSGRMHFLNNNWRRI